MTQPQQMQLICCPTCGSVRLPLKDVVVVTPKNGLVRVDAAPETTPCPVCEVRNGLTDMGTLWREHQKEKPLDIEHTDMVLRAVTPAEMLADAARPARLT